MKWVDIHFRNEQKADIKTGEVVDIVWVNGKIAHLGVGNMAVQDTPGTPPMPRRPAN